MFKRILAIALGLTALLLPITLSGGSAQATDNANYYLGTTWNPFTNDWPSSYAPSGSNKGVGRIDHGASFQVYVIPSTQHSRMLSGSGVSGNSSKMKWDPCSGANFMQPCYSSAGTLALKQLVLQDRYGVVATAVPSTGYSKPTLFAEETHNDTLGLENFRPHVTALGNIDYVAYGNGNGPIPFTTTHVSGTGGFTTPIPLTWTPQLCWNFQAVDAYQAGGPYHYYVCAPLVPHNI